MRGLFAVYKREVLAFFRSSVAYGVAFALLLFLGLLYADSVSNAVTNNASGMMQQPIVADSIIVNILGVLVFLMFIIAPLLTMRLISEESREGTLEVLMTMPMGDWAFVTGKFLAVWTFYTFILLLTGIYVLLLSSLGVPDTGLILVAYLGAWLYGGLCFAIGMVWSAITEEQIVAAFLSAGTILLLFLADRLAVLVSDRVGGVGDFIRELSLTAHYQDSMLVGLVRAQDIAFFFLVIVFALFITTILVGSRRWRAS
jgi:ABC-2 type transport system permease protein